MIDFKPSPTTGKQTKFAPSSVVGIFVGYHIQPGAKYTGDIYAISMEALDRSRDFLLRDVHVQRVRSFLHPLPDAAFVFPLKIEFDAIREKAMRPGPPPGTGP